MTNALRDLETPYGTISVSLQGDLDVYVDHGTLDLPAGVIVEVTGHVVRPTPTSLWGVERRYFTIRRRDSKRDTTSLMDNKIYEAVEQAVATIPEADLAASQRQKRDAAAAARDELAARLRDLADRLTVEAIELRAGGREEYHDHHHRSGFTESSIRHVRTRRGELLPSLPEVKLYASHKYGPRLPNEES